ncbi:uncharacterized protein LOC9637429 [Selaginella moellendorffii]|uniref:uncharacterized protein LOC9637429 n=1 Tax=Selaginella moellendorffii TaxID=88036 RepID=UPI000D1C702D|nr:uncharacterized protein LOC9637429 [Selaginella moellendorffii]|eukprot:XP_002974667.2 uncharacterized protein LOC9637429 [Selaginella moellendorffii]
MDLDYVKVGDGRLVAFRELGCPREAASRSLLVLHGLGSSRIAAIPGVRQELLEEFGVRLVAIDRAGYGKSDPDPNQTLRSSAVDLEAIIDKLELGRRVWLLGYSGGAGYCWAAARYIPHKIHGIALWAPVGNYWWKGISDAQRKSMISALTPNTKLLFSYMKYVPPSILRLYARFVLARRAGQRWVDHCKATLSPPDQKHLAQHEFAGLLLKDNLESITFNQGAGLAKDLELLCSCDWGFELDEVGRCFEGPIHIWQGSDDRLVSLELQRWIKSTLPQTVELHELDDALRPIPCVGDVISIKRSLLFYEKRKLENANLV